MNEHSNRFWQDMGVSEHDTHLIKAIECLPQPAWVFDRDGRYVAQSRIDRETHGNLVGLLPTEAKVGPEDGQRWLKFHLRVIAGEHFHHMRELETIRGLIHSETAVSPLWHDGRIVGGIGISVDQTKRVKAERAFKGAQERLLSFVRISSDWAWETDEQHRFTLVLGDKNRLGIDFDGWLGKTRWELVGSDPLVDEPWKTYHGLVRAHAPIADFVYSLRTCHGQEMWIEVNAVPMHDADGRFTGYRGVSRNVTERERLHRMLRRSDLVIRATGNIILLIDREGMTEWANPAFTHLTGYSLDEVTGRWPGDLLFCDETDPATIRAIRNAIATGTDIRTRLINQTKSGERHWFDLHLRPLRDEHGETTGYICHQSVITDLVLAQQRLRATIDGVAAGMLRFNPAGEIVECNPEACRLLAMDEAEILRATPDHALWTMIGRDGSPRPWSEIPAAKVLATGEPIRDEVIGVRLAGNDIRWLRVNAHRAVTGTQAAADVIMSFIDVTGDEMQKRELDAARRLLHDVIEAVPDGIAAFDAEDRLILCNEAYREIYAPVREAISVGLSFETLLRKGIATGLFADAGSTPEQQERWLAARLAAHRSSNPAPTLQQLSDGRWLQARECRSESGVSVGVRSDITALKNAEIAIRRMAETDSLTGLSDRSVMMREVTAALRQPAVPDGQAFYVMLDLDQFKAINDSLGHDGGDQLLCVIANRLRRNTRKSDIVARLGGDEFALLIAPRPEVPDPEAMIARLHKAATARVSISGRSFRPGVSMGVTRLPQDGPSPRDLIKNADIALYRSKDRGRNGWTFFEPALRERFERRRGLADRLRRSLASRQIDLCYAPWQDLASGAITGYEARPQLRHEGVLLDQDALIAAAEESGLGPRLSETLLERICATLSATVSAGSDPGVVAVNLTRESLREPALAETVRDVLARHAIAPRRLALEVAETALGDPNPAPVLETLEALHALGITIVLDDFGKSTAALVHLKRTRLARRLKLHCSLVSAMADSRADAAIVRSVIDLAHEIGLEVAADGVENNAQREQLREFGCDIIQGSIVGPCALQPFPSSRT